MINLIQSPESMFYSQCTRIILISPPPFVENYWRERHIQWALTEGGAETVEEALHGSDRSGQAAKEYASACMEVAKEAGVEGVDVHSGLIQAAGGRTEEALMPFFT